MHMPLEGYACACCVRSVLISQEASLAAMGPFIVWARLLRLASVVTLPCAAGRRTRTKASCRILKRSRLTLRA